MTREEAERRKTEESHRPVEQMQGSSVENLGRPSTAGHGVEHESAVQSPPMSPSVEKTMRKAQKQTDKATPAEKGRSKSEEEKPERTLRTTEEARGAATLPVVAEAGESGESNEKQPPSPPEETEEDLSKLRSESPVSMNCSTIPVVRKVSPSTVGPATDTKDDTSMSSPHAMDFEPGSQIDDESVSVRMSEERPKNPPRIASDLVQPQTPLEDSVMRSLNEKIRAEGRP